MKGFVQDSEGIAVKNDDFRRVVYTAKNRRLVVMGLRPGEEIGAEVHTLDQFFRVGQGTGEAVVDRVRRPAKEGFEVLVPTGANHSIINTGAAPLKLYTLCPSPARRPSPTVGASARSSSMTQTRLPRSQSQNVSYPEGDKTNTKFAFQVTLSASSGEAVTVTYRTADGSATVSGNRSRSFAWTYSAPATPRSVKVAAWERSSTTTDDDSSNQQMQSAKIFAAGLRPQCRSRPLLQPEEVLGNAMESAAPSA